MARQRTQYKLIGRYMNGKDTIYYVLVSEDGKEIQYSEEQMAFFSWQRASSKCISTTI